MDIPLTHVANTSLHTHWQHGELEKLRPSCQIHVAVIDDLRRANLTCQTDLQGKDLELQLYYKHINKLVHSLNQSNFVLTSTQSELVKSTHVNIECQIRMEEYKRQCEILMEQLKHSEEQKAELEQITKAMYDVMEKARGFIDGEFSTFAK